jgi:N-acetylglucosaminyldiphosphoundecaprenol N-acetyl-beta-D-mannosaminyltransferase
VTAGGAARLDLLGLPLDSVDLPAAVATTGNWVLEGGASRTVVTLNPEIVVQAETDRDLAGAIRAADLVTADGVGIVWAAKQLLGVKLPGRATGVDIAVNLMKSQGPRLNVFFLGARPGVAERAAENCANQYGIRIAGARDGYFPHAEDAAVASTAGATRPNLVLTGLGAGRQEVFNESWRSAFPGAVLIGCGGTIDVLAGEVELAPAWTRQIGVEWVWRVVTMRRWARARRLAQFAGRVLRRAPGVPR